jgi:hypothetical protein
VFDHSMKNRIGEYHIYGCDDTVTDFIDEAADSKQGIRLSKTSLCPEGHFQTSGLPFVVKVIETQAVDQVVFHLGINHLP